MKILKITHDIFYVILWTPLKGVCFLCNLRNVQKAYSRKKHKRNETLLVLLNLLCLELDKTQFYFIFKG